MIAVEALTAPPTTPVTVGEFKAHARIEHTLEEDLIAAYIEAATGTSERITGRFWVDRIVRQTLSGLYDPEVFRFARVPFLELVSIEGQNGNGTWETLPYPYVKVSEDAIRFLERLPTTFDAIRCTYHAGYHRIPDSYTEDDLEDARNAVPVGVRVAILQMAASIYEDRQGTGPELKFASQVTTSAGIPATVVDLLRQYTVWGF